jgi:hypothetical protein
VYFTIGGNSCEKAKEATKKKRIYNFVFNGWGFYYIPKIKLKTEITVRKIFFKRHCKKN